MGLVDVCVDVYVVWEGLSSMLGDGSLCSMGLSCRGLYELVRLELMKRAFCLLQSGSSGEHRRYPLWGYYGVENFYDEGDEDGMVQWVICGCMYHVHERNAVDGGLGNCVDGCELYLR